MGMGLCIQSGGSDALIWKMSFWLTSTFTASLRFRLKKQHEKQKGPHKGPAWGQMV